MMSMMIIVVKMMIVAIKDEDYDNDYHDGYDYGDKGDDYSDEL